MKKILTQTLLFAGLSMILWLPNQLSAQKISNYYSCHPQEGGAICHIPSIKPFKAKNTVLLYDLTYITAIDSMVINIFYLSKEILTPDSIFLTGTDFYFAAPLKKIYTDAKKKIQIYRYTFSTKVTEGKKFFDLTVPPVIYIQDKNAKKHPCYSSRGNWKKSAGIIRRILMN